MGPAPLRMPDFTHLNLRLEHELGRGPLGLPLFRWEHSSRLMIPVRREGQKGITFERQLPDDYWLIASWEPPTTPDELYGSLPWGRQGHYCATTLTLPPSEVIWVGGDIGFIESPVEPTWAMTDTAIGNIKGKRRNIRSLRDSLDSIQAGLEKKKRASAAVESDIIDDACPAFYSDPGKRGGHVSFGGI